MAIDKIALVAIKRTQVLEEEKIPYTSIVNDFSGGTDVPLSAEMGKTLNTRVEVLEEFNPLESWEDVQTAVRAGVIGQYLPIGSQIVAEWNGTPVVWEVIGIDHDTPTDTDFTHSLTIQAKDCLMNAVFSAAQALYHAVEGLSAGSHIFTLSGAQYTFTSTEPIPEGGLIIVTAWGEGSYVPTTVRTLDADRVTIIESSLAVTPTTGEDTLVIENTATRIRYGSNNYIESAIKQWLNSDAENWVWESKTLYDRPSSYTTEGFLKLLDPELVAVIGSVEKQVARNTVSDGGGQDIFSDKVFLLSRKEMFGDNEGTVTGESVYPFWDGSSNADRIKTLSGSARWWWLRSPLVTDTHRPRTVSTSGAGNSSSAFGALGLVPACVII